VPSDGVCRCPTKETSESKYHERCKITAKQVADAIRDCALGFSTVTLGKRLGMAPSSTRRMIENPLYSTGRYEVRRADGSTYVHRCEPLIDPDIQKQAIAAIKPPSKSSERERSECSNSTDSTSATLSRSLRSLPRSLSQHGQSTGITGRRAVRPNRK
jgi:hypothetical protein